MLGLHCVLGKKEWKIQDKHTKKERNAWYEGTLGRPGRSLVDLKTRQVDEIGREALHDKQPLLRIPNPLCTLIFQEYFFYSWSNSTFYFLLFFFYSSSKTRTFYLKPSIDIYGTHRVLRLESPCCMLWTPKLR